MKDEKLAKEITDCDNCPLSDGLGNCSVYSAMYPGYGLTPEPPCASWSDDTIVYDGMYD